MGIVISSFVGLFFWTIPSTKYIVIYGENRFCGLTDNPNHLEIMNVIALSMLIYLVIKNKIGWVKAGFYFVCFEVFGLLTQSKTFLICQIILLIIVLICMIKRNKRTGLIFSAIFLILIILICIIFSEKILKIIERFTQDYGYTNWLDVVTTGRWSLFKAYFNDFINSGVVTILFGKGLTSPITFKNTIHNLYLYLLYYLGIVGICLVMAILISYLFIVKEKKKRFELINFLPMFMLLVLGVAERIFFTSTFIIFIPFIFLFDNENKQDKTSEDLIMQKLKYLKFKDFVSMIGLLLVFIPAIITKLFIRDFWLVCEDENEARDNGYWFFKYISENHPKQKVAYAINKKSPDYNKVKGLGKIISYGTLSHWFWYLVADKNISSQKGGKPNAAVCYLFEVVFKLRKNNRIFLQHGVTINDAKFIYYNQTYMRMLTTSTFQEFDYINERFGYPKDYVKLLGMPRFDNLNNNNLKSDQILVMPTWRNWISREVECEKYEGTKIFTETGYYKTWNEFLNSKELDKWLTKNKKKIVFYPHRNMQKYIHLFNTTSENITIADVNNYDVQTLLNESSVLITDYSSVFFDFAYLEKPIIFYQFDEEKFRKGQYAEGYFDYHNNDLGFWTNTIKGVLENLNKINLQGTLCNGKKYFKYIDNKNCERNYLAIKNLKNNKLKDGKKRKND
ncbi:MAG: CDP-glycerol glycerophosphotransferase family protein [Christensenellales bacterium]